MDIFAERLKSTFATLVRPLTPEDGESEASISVAEARLALRLPAVLREYYLLAGRFDRFNRAHNELRRPDEWSVDGDKLVFLDENQYVVSWGVDAGTSPDDDPPIYQAENVQGRQTEWFVEHEPCSEFLIVMLHLQAAWGGYEFLGWSEIESESLTKFLTGWTSTGSVKELLAFNRPGGAACVLKSGASSQLYVEGRTEQDFELIENELKAVGVELDHF
jgi:hypothetical protein